MSIPVVNCFHFSVSLGYTTTKTNFTLYCSWLWIAFIFQYLWDTQQLAIPMYATASCCELLSFFSIFGIHNNETKKVIIPGFVVNCFHFSVSLGYTTTCSFGYVTRSMLWIAFIFQYLWDTQQLKIRKESIPICCELLSFFSIFGIHNNIQFCWFSFLCVVNCFHFSVSLGYTTTK